MATKSPPGRKDLALVREGARSCAMLTVPEENLLGTLLDLDAAGLCYAFSGQKLADANRVSCGTYTYQRTAVRLDDPREGDFLLYVARDDEVLAAAREADHARDDAAVGRLLGYPGCCIAAFSERFQRNVLGNSPLKMIEPYWAVDAPREAPFILNVFARFYGQSILSHYPCALDCAESIKLGNQYLECLESAEPGLAARLRKDAQCDVAVSPELGLWAFRGNKVGDARRPAQVAHAVPWSREPADAWMFVVDQVTFEPVPDGLLFLGPAGQTHSVAARSFHFY